MSAGILGATLLNIGGINTSGPAFLSQYSCKIDLALEIGAGLVVLGSLTLVLVGLFREKEKAKKIDSLISFCVGIIFGLGLLISGMCRRSNIIGFLTLKQGWNPALIFVMVGAVGLNLITFQFSLKTFQRPFLAESFELPKTKEIDRGVVIGPLLFGLGWGISGLCPGPAMVNCFISLNMVGFTGCIILGQHLVFYSQRALEKKKEE